MIVHLYTLITMLPHKSILFPYTTLFRSIIATILTPDAGELVLLNHKVEGMTEIEKAHFRNFCQDRKSTRLNSSHRCISYAVFCLKKKMKVFMLRSSERLRSRLRDCRFTP